MTNDLYALHERRRALEYKLEEVSSRISLPYEAKMKHFFSFFFGLWVGAVVIAAFLKGYTRDGAETATIGLLIVALVCVCVEDSITARARKKIDANPEAQQLEAELRKTRRAIDDHSAS